jgi:hypothetical protein
MGKARSLASGLVVPVVVAVYLLLFWRDTEGFTLAAVGFPRLLILILAVLISVQTVKELRRHAATSSSDTPVAELADADGMSASAATISAEGPPLTGEGIRPMVTVAVLLAAYILVLPWIGAYPSTALFAAALSVALGYRRPLPVALSVVICVVTVAIFIQTFSLPLAGFGR